MKSVIFDEELRSGE